MLSIDRYVPNSWWVRARYTTFVFFAVLAMPSNIYTAETKNIYQGKAQVSDRSKAQRNEAIKQALENVLSKLLSRQALSDSNTIESILAESAQYVHQYRYEILQSAQTQKGNSFPLALVVRFAPFALNNALKSKGLNVWGTDRSEILLWMVLEKNRTRKMFAADTMPELAASIIDAAENKGLPILFPLMDLTDRQQLSTEAIWTGDDDRILQASERYGVEHILVGRITLKGPKQRDVKWTFLRRNRVDQWREISPSFEHAINAGFGWVFDQMISVYAPVNVGNGNSGVRIKVSGITNLMDINRVTDYLESVSAIVSVAWLAIEQDSVIFVLTLNGDENKLNKLLEAEGRLAPTSEEIISNVMHYRIVR